MYVRRIHSAALQSRRDLTYAGLVQTGQYLIFQFPMEQRCSVRNASDLRLDTALVNAKRIVLVCVFRMSKAQIFFPSADGAWICLGDSFGSFPRLQRWKKWMLPCVASPQ